MYNLMSCGEESSIREIGRGAAMMAMRIGWSPASNSEARGMYFRREGRILERGGTGRGRLRIEMRRHSVRDASVEHSKGGRI